MKASVFRRWLVIWAYSPGSNHPVRRVVMIYSSSGVRITWDDDRFTFCIFIEEGANCVDNGTIDGLYAGVLVFQCDTNCIEDGVVLAVATVDFKIADDSVWSRHPQPRLCLHERVWRLDSPKASVSSSMPFVSH